MVTIPPIKLVIGWFRYHPLCPDEHSIKYHGNHHSMTIIFPLYSMELPSKSHQNRIRSKKIQSRSHEFLLNHIKSPCWHRIPAGKSARCQCVIGVETGHAVRLAARLGFSVPPGNRKRGQAKKRGNDNTSNRYPLAMTNIAMGNGPFIEVYLFKNGDFPWLC